MHWSSSWHPSYWQYHKRMTRYFGAWRSRYFYAMRLWTLSFCSTSCGSLSFTWKRLSICRDCRSELSDLYYCMHYHHHHSHLSPSGITPGKSMQKRSRSKKIYCYSYYDEDEDEWQKQNTKPGNEHVCKTEISRATAAKKQLQ